MYKFYFTDEEMKTLDRRNSKARTRWHLFYTLQSNPSLRVHRKFYIRLMKQLRERREKIRMKGIIDDTEGVDEILEAEIEPSEEKNVIYHTDPSRIDQTVFSERGMSVIISPDNDVKVPSFKWRKATVKPYNTDAGGNKSENC